MKNAFPKFTSPVSGMLREGIDDYNKTRNIIFLSGLRVEKVISLGVYMILKKIMEVAQYYNIFNYGTPRSHKDIKSQDQTIVAGPRDNLAYQGTENRKLVRKTHQIR